MTLKFGTSLRNGMVGSVETTISGSPQLKIYSGGSPANITDVATGDLLVDMTLPSDWLTSPSSGSVSKNGTWSTTGAASGSAGYFRIVDPGATSHIQGTVAVAGADLLLDNVSINTGQTVTITQFTLIAGNS